MPRKFPDDFYHTRCCKCSFCKIERECNNFVSMIVYKTKRLDREFAKSAKNNPHHIANFYVHA